MPAITPALAAQGYQLTAAFYAANIECAPLVAFNNWMTEQMSGSSALAAPAETTARTARSPRNTGAAAGEYDAAVLTAVQSAPAGIGIAGLTPIVASYGKPKNQLGAALGRLTRAGKIEKKGDLWLAIPSAEVDRSIVTGARKRGRPPANADAGAEPQPMAAAG